MIELYELRVFEKYAGRIFRADEGEVLSSGLTRKVLIAPDDPAYRKYSKPIERLERNTSRSWEELE